MGVSKVTLNGDTLMDITSDTVDQNSLLTGFTAHGADGETVAGGYTPATYDIATETTDGLMSSEDKKKLNGIANNAEENVQVDWNESDTSSDAYIKNKPANLVSDASYVHTDNNYTTIDKNKLNNIAADAEANVQADWDVTDSSSDAYIKNKPTIPTVPEAATQTPTMDGAAATGTSEKYAREDHVHPSDTTKVDKVSGKCLSTNDFTTTLLNKLNDIAEGAEANVQSDWNITDTTSDAYIKNKPTIPTIESHFTLSLASTAWSSTTTTVNSIPYYTATVAAASLVKEYPTIYCGSSSTLPSRQEKDAFNLIDYAIADVTNHNITFYATIKPTVNLTINVIG